MLVETEGHNLHIKTDGLCFIILLTGLFSMNRQCSVGHQTFKGP